MTAPIYRLSERSDWRAAQTSGLYLSADLAIEGFLHTSTAEQVAGVAQRYYAGRADLVLLEIQTRAIQPILRWEASTGGESFPHVYGGIPLLEISRVASFPERSAVEDASPQASLTLLQNLAWQNWPPADLSGPSTSPLNVDESLRGAQ